MFIQTLVETAERELQSLGVQTIDEAADAALTLSGLQLQDNTELECGKGGGRWLYNDSKLLNNPRSTH